MRIVIVGAGISGLACYLFLQKHLPSALPSTVQLEIIIFESHAATKQRERSESAGDKAGGNTIGAAVGLAPNGLSVLRDLDETIFAQVANSGYPISHFHLTSANGYSLARIGATNGNNPELHTVLISRQRLWDCLRDHVPDTAFADRRSVSAVTYDNYRPVIRFSDASLDLEADLVIGADGVRSVVKRAVTGDCLVDRHPPSFDGMVGVGGFIPSSLLPKDEPRGRMTITFGAQGFFGYGACTIASQSNHFAMCTAPMGDQAVWWSTYETSHPPDTRNFDKQDIIRQLQKRHAGWKDPVIQEIVADAAIDSVYPTWITPELPTWHAHGIVIVGDAAHAMQPSSGQGTSQALEDVQVLSMLLAHYLERHFSQSADRVGRQVPATVDEAVDQASEKYFELRRPRVKRIVDRAKQMGDTKRKKGIFEEYLTYSILWVIGKLPIDSYTKQLYNDLPVNQVKKFIEEDKLHPVPLYETTHILWD